MLSEAFDTFVKKKGSQQRHGNNDTKQCPLLSSTDGWLVRGHECHTFVKAHSSARRQFPPGAFSTPLLVQGQEAAQFFQGAAFQAGNVHLGQTHLFGDLPLG